MGKIVENEKIVWDEQIAGDDSNQVNVTLLCCSKMPTKKPS